MQKTNNYFSPKETNGDTISVSNLRSLLIYYFFLFVNTQHTCTQRTLTENDISFNQIFLERHSSLYIIL